MVKKKSEPRELPICAGQIESRRIIRDHAREPMAATELETLRAIARSGRELEEALCVYHETRDSDAPESNETRAELEQRREAAAQRMAEARSAHEINLHAWEWWTFDETGARGARKRAW